MQRIFVPFDDSYRVPADVRVSRGVRCGDLVVICGQLDMDGTGQARHSGELDAQTTGAMALLGDVLRGAGAGWTDVAHLHAFYRQDGTVDEDAFVARLTALAGGGQPVIVPTPVASFPMAGIEVEIDAVAVAGGSGAATADGRGARRGDMIFAHLVPPRDSAGRLAHPGDIGAQTAALLAGLDDTLAALGAVRSDLCKLCFYTSREADPAAVAESLGQRAAAFAAPGPVQTDVPVPRLGRPGELVRLEAVAVVGAAPRRHLDPVRHGSAPWSPALRVGNLVFVGAQLPLDGGGTLLHAGDLAAQTHAAMAQLRDALGGLGAGLEHMVKVNAFFAAHADSAAWQTNVGIRSGYYAPPGPASTGIEVPGLTPEGALIQVDCLAVVP